MIWIVTLVGFLLAFFGSMIVVGAATVSRLELARWISHRLRGAALASTLFSAPGRILRTASALAALGFVLTGLGAAALLGSLPPAQTLVMIVIVGAPVIAVAGYAMPRTIARRWPETVVRRASPVFERLIGVLRPFVPAAEDTPGRELTELLLKGYAGAELEPEEARVISGVITFAERPVHDVMTSRTEVVAVAEGTALEEIGRICAESGYSRIPVYRNSLDTVIGMVYAFDLLKVAPGNELPVRPVAVTPGAKACGAVIYELQRQRLQMAVVLDEFGGTAGIVTLEDLLEDFVGEVFDEGDDVVLSDGWGPELQEFDGAAPLGEVATRFGVSFSDEIETVGGFLAHHVGRIPQPGERITCLGLEFDVLRASPTRVERLIIRRVPAHAIELPTGAES